MARKEKVAIPPLEEHKALAREMNEVMKLDPPIKFSKKTTADELLEIIKNEATGNIYEIDFEPDPEDDSVIVFSEKAEDDFKALGIEVLPGSPPDPAAEADEPDEEVIEEKPAAKPDTKKGGKKEEPTKKDEKPAAKKADKKADAKKEEPTKKEKEPEYTRSEAFVDALKKGGTKKEIIDNSDALFVKEGGESNHNVARAVFGYAMNPLLLLGHVTVNKDGVHKHVKQ